MSVLNWMDPTLHDLARPFLHEYVWPPLHDFAWSPYMTLPSPPFYNLCLALFNFLNHIQLGLSWLPSWPCSLHLHSHAFPHPILLIFPLHMTKPPPPIYLQNITNCLYVHPIPQFLTSYLLSLKDVPHIHLTIHISVLSSIDSCPFFIGHVSPPCSFGHSSYRHYLSVWATNLCISSTQWEDEQNGEMSIFVYYKYRRISVGRKKTNFVSSFANPIIVRLWCNSASTLEYQL